MDQTPNLGLPYLLAAQQQKHVTHNETLRALDCVVQLTVRDRNLAAPPVTPAEGDRYIVAASPTGAWAGHAGQIAAYQDAAWLFYPPIEGWITWIADENIAVAYDGAAWVTLSGGVTSHAALTGLSNDDHPQYLTNARGDARFTPLNPVTLGINATADSINKLAVASAASLFNHPGSGGHQIKINKAAAADTASFLFQTGFSGRAELGTTGDDDFHFKVSPNGTSWSDAITISRTSGACSFPNTSLGSGTVTSVATGTGLTGGPISASGTVSLANMAANSLKGNNTGASAAPADLTAAQVKTLLTIGTADVSGLGPLATSSTVNLSAQATGTLQAAQEPAHTGDVTNAAGSLALTIAANAVTNAKAAQMAASTIKGNNTGATANAADLTTAQATAMLDVAAASGPSAKKGLAPAPPGTAGAVLFLREDMSWSAPPGAGGGLANAYANITDGTNTATSNLADTFKIRTDAHHTAVVANNDATHGDNVLIALANMAAKTIKANVTGATAAPADATVDQVAGILPAGAMERGQRLTPRYETDFMHATFPQGPWVNAPLNSGTIAALGAGTFIDAQHPGVAAITSSTTANSGFLVAGNATQMILGGGEQFDCVFRTGAAFTNTTMRLGFHDCSSSADAVDGCYLEVGTTGIVTGKTSSNSTRTTSATITTLAVNTWYHGRVKLNAGATGCDFTVYDMSGTSLGTANITTNIPTAAGRECTPAFIATNSGTVATQLVLLDYMSFGYQGRTLVRGALT